MTSGGPREGKPGKSYGNRTDLNRPTPSRHYGDAANQKRQMDAIPIQPPPSPAAGGGMAAPPQMRVPPPFDRPTERPDEPVQAGLSTGPGATPAPTQNLEKLRPLLPVLELLASRPDVGVEARNLIRRLRGALG